MRGSNAYEVFEELGRGQHTIVSRGFDIALGREVAIKQLNETERKDPVRLEAFLGEARFLAQFEHDNVLRVHAVDQEQCWIVMERMRGTLATLIDDGPSMPDLVRSVMRQTLDALQFLHENDKVHGSIRPTNLLINDRGRVKLSDFEQIDPRGELRAPTGSKKYLAPELVRTQFGPVGPALDLYCLAFTALELLAGSTFDSFFPGAKGAIDADMAWLRWHSSEEDLDPVGQLISGLPNDLAAVLDQMLSKQVEDRPASAGEVLELLDNLPIVSVPVEIIDESGAEKQSHERTVVRTVVKGRAGRASKPVELPATAVQPPTNSRQAKKPPKANKQKPRKTTAPRFSQAWLNEQLARPYVLYPICALMLAGFGLLSLALRGGGSAASEFVDVRLAIQPDAEGVVIEADGEAISPTEEGLYRFTPGKHALMISKPDYESYGLPIEVAADSKEFSVTLTKAVQYVQAAFDIKPQDATVWVDDQPREAPYGKLVLSLADDASVKLRVEKERFAAIEKSY